MGGSTESHTLRNGIRDPEQFAESAATEVTQNAGDDNGKGCQCRNTAIILGKRQSDCCGDGLWQQRNGDDIFQPEQAAQQQQVAQGDYKAQVVALMNQERANAGIGGISQNASLDAVAQIRAQEIAQSFSHTRPNGTSCFTVLDENGIAYMTAGENIAAGYGDPASVMSGWMNSPGHRANILNGSFGQVGIGYYTDPNSGYGTYWVQIFTN